jgi:hypothetical protein
MKKTFAVLSILAFCLLAVAQLAPTNKPARVLVMWDPNPESDIGGYKIYHGTNSRVYDVVLDVGNVTNAILSNFTRGVTYYFAATAYNTIPLESDFSEEVTLTIPALPASPTNVIATNVLETVAIGAFLEKADDVVGPWTLAQRYPTNYIDPIDKAFYRIGLTIDHSP